MAPLQLPAGHRISTIHLVTQAEETSGAAVGTLLTLKGV
jgi:hypothetical protein